MTAIWSASGRGVATSALAMALVACGNNIDVASTSTAGVGASASSSSSASTGGSSGAGGAGGSSALPDPTCAPGEAALVVATGTEQEVIAFAHGGAWTTNSSVVPPKALVASYVDAAHRLGAFWIDSAWQSHFAATADGASFDVHDVHGWAPKPWEPFAAVATDVLLGTDMGGTSLARFDPDASDWAPYLAPTPITATSAAPLGNTGEILVVGLGPSAELCDVATQSGAWGSVECRDDVHVMTTVGGEITLSPPRAVTLPNGDVVVVYYSKDPSPGVRLAATTLHAGAWSAPDYVSPAVTVGVAFTATATPKGDVIVGIASGAASALRYTPGVGWSAPIPIEANALYNISAAPGICGDDALLAYGGGEMEHEVRVARVRGDVAEAFTIADFGVDYPGNMSISTRPASSP